MTRAATWSNPDGLVVGFGANYAERNVAGVERDGAQSVKTAKFTITKDTVTGTGNNGFTLPAGVAVNNVYVKVRTTFVGGTSIAIGDGGNTSGWITAAAGATANLTANAVLTMSGAYGFTATEGRLVPKPFASATPTFVTIVGTFTAGEADVYIEYV